MKRLFQVFNNGRVVSAVVDDGVAFGAIEEFLNMCLGAAGDADEGVDVGAEGELDCVVALNAVSAFS